MRQPGAGSLPPPQREISFAGVIGQERMKLALLLAAIDPRIGGVLIRGERGTAKSTLVRALPALLPPQLEVADCPYHCDPDGTDLCQSCAQRRASGEQLPGRLVPVGVVELPLGASEDRVVGSIDWEEALQGGRRSFQPGLLASAHRQILYVDEVNLLEQHLVDVLLDVAASGWNVVEREGIAAQHPSNFVLVGTMNPEEGDLRPQLLDRFGLCVDVVGLTDPALRVKVMEAHLGGAGDGEEMGRLLGTVSLARKLLEQIEVPDPLMVAAASISLDQQVMGHRSDLILLRAARAHHALSAAEASSEPGPSSRSAGLQDLMAVAELVLVHRRRSLGVGRGDAAGDAPERAPEQVQDQVQSTETESAVGGEGAQADDQSGSEEPQQETETGGSIEPASTSLGSSPAPTTALVEVEEAFEVARLIIPKERRRRSGRGRRSQTTSADRRGRYVGAEEATPVTDLALDATIRAAAPHQLERRARRGSEASPVALAVEPQDLRQKIRQRRIGNLIVFVVDASASMDAEQRMRATRSAILALLRDAYVRRDRVALISFSGRSARLVLRPTASVDLAERRLGTLSVGGTTPLTHGLVMALELIKAERMRDSEVLPLLVLISDGRGNISYGGDEPLVEAQREAQLIRAERIRSLVIDSAHDASDGPRTGMVQGSGPARLVGYNFNACADLAERMGAQYYGLLDLSEGSILRPISAALQ